MHSSYINTTGSQAAWFNWEASRATYLPPMKPLPESVFLKIWGLCESDYKPDEGIPIKWDTHLHEKSKSLITKLNTLYPATRSFNERSIKACFKTVMLERTSPRKPIEVTQNEEQQPPIDLLLKELSLEYSNLKPLTRAEITSIWLECKKSVSFQFMGPTGKPKHPGSYLRNKVSSLFLKRVSSGRRADDIVRACIRKIVGLLIGESPKDPMPMNLSEFYNAKVHRVTPERGQPPLKKVKGPIITDGDWEKVVLDLEDDASIMDDELRKILLEDDPVTYEEFSYSQLNVRFKRS